MYSNFRADTLNRYFQKSQDPLGIIKKCMNFFFKLKHFVINGLSVCIAE